MKAVVWHGVGDIRRDEVPDPKIQEPSDAIIRITRSAICGTDLHVVRGTIPDMVESTVLGHEAVGVVEETGPAVRGFSRGDRVVVTSTIGCGTCSYCRAGYYAQCDTANPNGPSAGTAQFRSFPIGAAMNKNLTVKMGHLQPTPIPARPARPRGRGHDRPHRVHHPA
jgi:threonine dehydrogenase-like Zn-dependent dehydrogenase